MTKTISREAPFQVLATNFSISPSSSGYTLQISADGVNYTDLFSVGANITRMVTGVANGSYYRLRGNTDTDVVVNWRTQCSDGGEGGGEGGGGSQYILPPATNSTLGGVKVGSGLSIAPDGTLSANGGGEGGDAETGILRSVDVLDDEPQAEIGDVKAKRATDGAIGWQEDFGTPLSNFTFRFPDGFDFTQYDDTNPYVLGVFHNDNRVGPEEGGETLYWEYSVEMFYVEGTGEIVGLRNGETFEAGMGYIHMPIMGSNDSEYGMVEASYDYMGTLTVNFTADSSGDPWDPTFTLVQGEHTNIEKNDGIWVYKSNPEWGRWIGKLGENSIGGDKSGTFLVYDYLPEEIDGEGICAIRYDNYGSDKWVFFNLQDGYLYTTDDNTEGGNVVDTIYPNSDTTVYNAGIGDAHIYWDTEKKFIRFYANYNGVYFPIATTIDGNGYERIDKNETIEFATNDQIITGFPKWDRNGRIVGQDGDKPQITHKRINNNGYDNTVELYTNGTNGEWGSWYIPTQGGTAGQVLTSNGNAEPTWATMIKAVQITSTAYEALATKDPNTLYLIVD